MSPEMIAAARQGEWSIVLTPSKPVPRAWFPPLTGLNVLCLASGGGQQAPILAAAGATVTVLDASRKQLEQDRMVAEREGLALRIVEGDMADLSMFADGSFDLIFHPCSNSFVPNVRPVWAEAFRVLRPGGTLLTGFNNPVLYTFDDEQADQGVLVVRHSLPYSDLTSLTEAERQHLIDNGETLAFSHSFDDQIGGQIDPGFVIIGFFEDVFPDTLHAQYMPTQMATRALKPVTGSIFSL